MEGKGPQSSTKNVEKENAKIKTEGRTVSLWAGACSTWWPAVADGAGAIASGMILLPSALKPKMAWWIWLMDGLGAVPCRNGQNCAPNN